MCFISCCVCCIEKRSTFREWILIKLYLKTRYSPNVRLNSKRHYPQSWDPTFCSSPGFQKRFSSKLCAVEAWNFIYVLSIMWCMLYGKMKHFQRVDSYQTVSEKPGTAQVWCKPGAAQMWCYTATDIAQIVGSSILLITWFSETIFKQTVCNGHLKICICAF